MAGGEPEHEPPVGRHEGVAVDVATELLHLRVLPSLVLEQHLPLREAEIAVGDLPPPPVVHRDLDNRFR
jgi:hypothetical protein